MPIRKRLSQLKGQTPGALLFGSETEFSFEHRIFNMTGFITILILAAFFCINVIIEAGQSTLLVFILLLIQIGFYVLSRRFRKYKSIILSYVIVVYSGLIGNYYFNAGINGPSLLLFFTTFQLSLNISTKEKYRLWLLLSMIIPASMIASEFYFPEAISGLYSSKQDKTIDLLGTYLLAIIYIYFAASGYKRHIMRQYELEKTRSAELAASSIRLRAFFESLSDNFVLLDRELKVLYFNKSALNLAISEYGRALAANQNIDDYIHDANKEMFHQCYHQALSGTQVVQEFCSKFTTREIWWQITFNPAYNEYGGIIGVSTVMKDITEGYLYQRRIERKNALLEQIAFIQAHELRGPLTSVQSLIGLIKDEYEEKDLIYTSKLEEGLNRLDTKIKEIITLSSRHNEEL